MRNRSGSFTGTWTQQRQDLSPGDWRLANPRFADQNFQRNLQLVERVRELAAQKRCTPGQLALAWVLAQGQEIVPIPGTKRMNYLEENLKALEVRISPEELRTLNEIAAPAAVAGERYPQPGMAAVNR